MTIAVRLDAEMEKRLEILSESTGRTKSFYIKLALTNFLEKQEASLLEGQNVKALQEIPTFDGRLPEARKRALKASLSSKKDGLSKVAKNV